MAFHRLINAALLDSVFTLDGDGQQQRDFTYVGDIVDARISAGFAPSPGSTYDIGQGKPHTLNSVIEFISEYLRGQIDIERNPEGDSGAEITRASAAAAAAAGDLGWTASTTLEFGLIRQIAHQETELQALSLA
jgi:nucleoside-diphosphate-sugar epimerase